MNLDTFNIDSIYRVLCNLSITSLDLKRDLAPFLNLTSMYELCKNCKNLKSVNLLGFDASKITTWSRAFWSTALTELDFSNLDTSNCKDFSSWIQTTPIQTLNLTNCNLSNCIDLREFLNSSNLTNILCDGLILPEIQLTQLSISSSRKVTLESLEGLLKALPVTTKGLTITLGTYHLNRLTDELKAIATNKGWILN